MKKSVNSNYMRTMRHATDSQYEQSKQAKDMELEMCEVTKNKTLRKQLIKMALSSCHQSGQRSVLTTPSSSGVSFIFIHLSGTWPNISVSVDGHKGVQDVCAAYKREVSLHCAGKALSILFWCYNGGLASACTTQKGRFFDPAFQLLVPGIRSDII